MEQNCAIVSKKYSISIAEHNVFRTRFSLFIFLSFPMGILNIPMNEKSDQKTLLIAAESMAILLNLTKWP